MNETPVAKVKMGKSITVNLCSSDACIDTIVSRHIHHNGEVHLVPHDLPGASVMVSEISLESYGKK